MPKATNTITAKWSYAADKLLLCSLIEIITYGEVPGAVWEMAATRMGGEDKGFTADKVSQHYNKTLKGGELVASNIGDDQFLTGAALCDAKMKLGVMTEVGMEATMQLQGTKTGQAGIFIRQTYLKGKELLDEKALLDSIRNNLAKKNHERAQGKPKGHGRLKKRKKRVILESDAEDEQSDGPAQQLDGKAKGRSKDRRKRLADTVEGGDEFEPTAKERREEADEEFGFF